MVACLLAAATLGACGSNKAAVPTTTSISSEPAATIMSSALAALRAARSVEVSESLPGRSGDSKVQFWLFNGSATEELVNGGSILEQIVIGRTSWLKGNLVYWQEEGVKSKSALGALSSHWVYETHLSASQVTSLASLKEGLEEGGKGHVTKLRVSLIDGVMAVGLISSKGGILWIPEKGTPYPVEVAGLGGPTLSLSNWDKGTPPSAPKGGLPESEYLKSS